MTKWIPNNPPHDLRPRCSACGNLFPVYTDYCPNCGEKMLNGKERQELRAAWVVEHQEAITSSAIRTLTEEYCHVCLHLLDGGKSPEYYIEMQQLATALEMGISALAKELPKKPPAPICQTCRNFETCPWRHEGIFSGPKDKARRVLACSDYKTE